jgi:hypothetical protein
MSFLLAPGTDAFSLRRSPCDDTQQTLISVSHLSRCFRCFERLGFPAADPACSAYDAANALAKEKDAGPARAFLQIPSMPGSACRQDRRGFRTADEPSQEKYACEPDYCFGGHAPAGLLNAVVHDFPVYLSPRERPFRRLVPGPISGACS